MLSLSSLNQQKEFAYLAAITLFVAWMTDLTFTPAIASRIRVVTLWDVLTLDLGENPHQAIPVFHGFSKWQARIVALMTADRGGEAGPPPDLRPGRRATACTS